MKNVIVKPAEARDWEMAMEVAWVTFRQNASRVGNEEGSINFRQGITSTQLYIDFLQGKCPLFCAYDGRKVVGMLSLRDSAHISLFFIQKEYQGRGIGTRLLNFCLEFCRKNGIEELTVNAASTGMFFYRAKGFQTTGEERFEGGLWATPMILRV